MRGTQADPRRRHRRLAMVVAGWAMVLGTAACTGGEPGPGPTGDASASGGNPSPSVSPTPIPYLTPTPDPVLASGSGTLPRTPVAVTVGVLAVQAGPQSTRLRLRFTSTEPVRPHPQALEGSKAGADIGAVELVASSADQRLAAVYASFGDLVGQGLCMCSAMPKTITPDGVDLYALYPPLPAGVTQVEVAVPGLRPITVPVTRTWMQTPSPTAWRVRRRSASRDEDGQVAIALVVLTVFLLLAASVKILMPLGRAADLRERAQAAADAAALAGVQDVRRELVERLSRPLPDKDSVSSWVACGSGGGEAADLAARNDAGLVTYCYQPGPDRVSVQVRGRTGIAEAGSSRPVATASAELGLRWGACRWFDVTPVLSHWRCGSLDVPFAVEPTTGVLTMTLPPGWLEAQLEPRLIG